MAYTRGLGEWRIAVVTLICRIVLGGMLLLAGTEHFLFPSRYGRAVRTFRIPKGLVSMANALPPLEVAAAVGLLAGVWPRLAALASLILIAGFTAFLPRRQPRAGCGCGPVLELGGLRTHLVANGALLGAALIVLLTTRSSGRVIFDGFFLPQHQEAPSGALSSWLGLVASALVASLVVGRTVIVFVQRAVLWVRPNAVRHVPYARANL